MSGTLWVDLTDLRAWSGHHTGVQRVVFSIASRYQARGNARFFAFDSDREVLHEVGAETLSAPTATPPDAARRSSSGGLTAGLRSAARRTPVSLRRRLSFEQRQAIKSAGRNAVAAARDLRRAARRDTAGARRPSSPVSLNVGSDDALLVLGKVWDEPALVDALTRTKLIRGCRLHYLVYDLIPVFQPHLFGPGLFERYASYLFDMCSTADGLLAISQSTRADLERFCADLLIPQPPIEVVRLGEDVLPQEQAVSGIEPGGFILTVGTLEVRKNHALLYNVWKLAQRHGVPLPRLVIVGGQGWLAGDALHLLATDPQVNANVTLLHDVSDAQLAWLYQHCRLSVYPSVFEGWGLPVAESLARGKVCVASNTSSMPEIAGDLIDYFDPYDAGECLRTLLKYLDDAVLAAKEAEIRTRYRRTGWDDTFAQVARLVTPGLP